MGAEHGHLMDADNGFCVFIFLSLREFNGKRKRRAAHKTSYPPKDVREAPEGKLIPER